MPFSCPQRKNGLWPTRTPRKRLIFQIANFSDLNFFPKIFWIGFFFLQMERSDMRQKTREFPPAKTHLTLSKNLNVTQIYFWYRRKILGNVWPSAMIRIVELLQFCLYGFFCRLVDSFLQFFAYFENRQALGLDLNLLSCFWISS